MLFNILKRPQTAIANAQAEFFLMTPCPPSEADCTEQVIEIAKSALAAT